MLSIAGPYPFFPDINGGPLDGGYVYVGEVDQSPETAPVTVYWDEALTKPALQPLRTQAGYIVRNGTPARVYASGDDVSMLCKRANGVPIFYEGSVAGVSTLRMDLTSTTDPAKGAGMGGFDWPLNYVVKTIGWGIQTAATGVNVLRYITPSEWPAVQAGTSVTNWTTQIQAAINSLPEGGELNLAGGTYIVLGVDITTTGVKIGGGKLVSTAALNRALVMVTADDVTIERLHTYLDSALYAVSVGSIGFDGCSGGRVKNCRISGGFRSGAASVNSHPVAAWDCDDVVVEGTTITGGLFTEHVYINDSTNCRVLNNRMSGGSYSAIAFVSASGVNGFHIAAGNIATNFGTSIITVDSGACTVSGNILDGSTAENGVNVAHTAASKADRTVVIGNTIRNCANYGVGVTESVYVLVTGNQISGGVNGVRIATMSTHTTVTGNIITDTTGSGVLASVGDEDSYIVISDNTLRNIDAHGIELIGGTRYEINDNTFTNVHNKLGGLPGGRACIRWDGSTGTNKPARLVAKDNILNNDSTLIGPGANRGIDIRNSVAALVFTADENDFAAVLAEKVFISGVAPQGYGNDVVLSWSPTLSTDTGTFGALGGTQARYRRDGRFLNVSIALSATVTGGAPTEFRLSYPFGEGHNADIYTPAYISVAGAPEIGLVRQTNAGYLSFRRLNGSAFTGAVAVSGNYTFEMA